MKETKTLAPELRSSASVFGFMNEWVQLSICALVLAAPFAVPLAGPAISAARRKRMARSRHPQVYLGEFIPPETPLHRERREAREAWQEFIAASR